MKTSFYSQPELAEIGFNSIGKSCMISRKASIFSPENIEIGDYVRIDDFCILSGSISIGSFVHISAYTALYGKYGILLNDFVTISARVLIFSQNDDYSGSFMTNPMVPNNFTNVNGGKIEFMKHSIVGAGSIVLPRVVFHEGSCLGAMSLTKNDLQEWKIYAGIPAKYLRDRNRDALIHEQNLKSSFL